MRRQVLAALALLAVVPACSSDSGGPVVVNGVAVQWQRLPDLPLDVRSRPLVADLDGRVLVVGGTAGPPCPKNADCGPGTGLRDGALFDPDTQQWRPIAKAPVHLIDVPHVAIGSRLFVLFKGVLVAYEAERDVWSRPKPPAPLAPDARLLAIEDRLVVLSSSRKAPAPTDRVLDPVAGTWSTLPNDPLGASFRRALTATPDGAVLTASPGNPRGARDAPDRVLAARLSKDLTTWTRLQDSTFPELDHEGGVMAPERWVWTGTRLERPAVDAPGIWFDPAAQTWGRLGPAPEPYSGGWPVYATGGSVWLTYGWFYDHATSTWAEVPRPGGAPDVAGPGVWSAGTLHVVGGRYSDRYDVDAYSAAVWRLAPVSS